MRGNFPHISDTNNRTSWTTDISKVPDIRTSTSYRPRTLDKQDHFFGALPRFETNASHFSSEDEINLPSYLKEDTKIRGLP